MKKLIGLFISGLLILSVYSCANNNTQKEVEKKVPAKEDTLQMNQDTLYARIVSGILEEVAKKRNKIDKEALTVVSETQGFLQQVEADESDKAIETGKKLIGELDILLSKNPDAALIPIDVQYRIDETVADIPTVRKITKDAKEAMRAGYYQAARGILENLKSEVVVTTYNIPTATYPIAIKNAVLLMQEGKKDLAKAVLQQVFGTIVIQEIAAPLPVLKAIEMLKEAQKIDAVDHKNADKVLNLLKNADYQLRLAEEMGYGKKNIDYKPLYKSIKELEKSVEKKADSKGKFEKMLEDINNFNDTNFPLN